MGNEIIFLKLFQDGFFVGFIKGVKEVYKWSYLNGEFVFLKPACVLNWDLISYLLAFLS